MNINIYCDESCHLEKDNIPVMVLGSLCCDKNLSKQIAQEIRQIKINHGLAPYFEIKWTKVSPAQQTFYLDILNYFLENPNLKFRALIIPDKSQLDHTRFNQNHDIWYYKMYYELLKYYINPENEYYIYLDKKDTRGKQKVNILHDILITKARDYNKKSIRRIQEVDSKHVDPLQMVDFLIGAVTYANRSLSTSQTKLSIIERLRQYTKQNLTQTTTLSQQKVNIFVWKPS
jgi:hypothetical protein